MAYDYSQAGYSQDVLDYINNLDARRNELIGKYAGQNVGLDNPDFLTPQQVQQEASDEIKTQYAPEEVVREYMSRNPLNSENNLNAGVDVRSYGDSRDPSVYDTARMKFGDTYTFTNKATGQTYTASTPEQMQAVRQAVSGLSTLGNAPMKDSTFGGGNNTANWAISNSAGDRIAYDSPYTPSFLKQAGQTLADQAPAALGAAIGGPLGAAALTSAYKGFGQGASLEDSLKGGAIAGAKVLAMNAIGPYISSGLTSAGLDFPGMDYIFPKDPNFFGSLGVEYPGTFGGGGYSGPIAGAPGVEAVQVSGGGSFYPGVGALAGVLPAQLATGSPSYAGQPGVEEVNVSAERTPVTSGVLPNIVAPVAANALTNLGGYDVPAAQRPVEEVNPTSKRTPGTYEYGAPFFVPTGLAAPSDSLADYDTGEQLGYGDKPTTEAPKEDGEGLSTSDYIRLGLTGASLLGGLVGGGGSGSGTGSSGMVGDSGKMPANFATDKLPTGDAVPAFGGGTSLAARTARPAADLGDIDYNRYGFGPEKSFFSNVPQRAAKGGSMAVTRPAKSYAVQGAGDGRSDDIPAVLSDGEYVMDAETVALLGNGSNKAGAAQLDRFRANVRKHKGKELAKGRFSINAKNPQAYFKGGA